MSDKMPSFQQIISEGERGYDTNITGFGPDILFNELAKNREEIPYDLGRD